METEDNNGSSLRLRVLRLEREVAALAAGDRYLVERIEALATSSREWRGELLRHMSELQAAIETVLGRIPERRKKG